jgi:hypothetical protein
MDMVELHPTCLTTLLTIGPDIRTSPLISKKYRIPHCIRNMPTTILSRYFYRGGDSPLFSSLAQPVIVLSDMQ